MARYQPFSGTITQIENIRTGTYEGDDCNLMISVVNREGNQVDFVVTPDTYFVDRVTVTIGDSVIGFYDADEPTIAIYPPQYRAVVMARNIRNQNVKVDIFNRRLVSGDGTLMLNIQPSTQILLSNDQYFTGNIANRLLIVIYGRTTRSLPAQTTPYRVVVLCGEVEIYRGRRRPSFRWN